MLLYQQLSDRDLFELLKKDDNKAFTELYERYHSLLYIYANKKLQHNFESRDIVQDVLMTIWHKRKQLTINGTFRSYLFTAVRNRILDVFAHHTVKDKYLDNLQDIIATATPSDFLIREKEISEMIEKEINAMPPRMREVFLLSRKEWLSNSEIADKLTISQATVETQMKRALRHLRLRLGYFSSFLFEIILSVTLFF